MRAFREIFQALYRIDPASYIAALVVRNKVVRFISFYDRIDVVKSCYEDAKIFFFELPKNKILQQAE